MYEEKQRRWAYKLNFMDLVEQGKNHGNQINVGEEK